MMKRSHALKKNLMNLPDSSPEGILLIDKPRGKTSFSFVSALRRRLGVKKIGHAGTLDPFATGVLVMLIGKNFTRLSDKFLTSDKEYIAQVHLGIATDTYDCDGQILTRSDHIPAKEDLDAILTKFQGEVDQIPPMFSAKKQKGKKLYEMARKGVEVPRQPVKVCLSTTLMSYNYPFVNLHVKCSKGTYVRSIAYDIGCLLGCGAHLSSLQRTRSGNFLIKDCLDGAFLETEACTFETLRNSLIYASH